MVVFWHIIAIFFKAGAILATADLSQHTVAGYDLYIYVTDGKTLVGPRTLTVILLGKILLMSFFHTLLNPVFIL